MELCYKYRYVSVFWCCGEILLSAGIIYGWGSLVFILKQDGFYQDACDTHHVVLNTSLDVLHVINLSNKSGSDPMYHTKFSEKICANQETKLNMWFSIGVGVMYIGLAFLGQMTQKLGTRITRTIFMFVYVCGTLCIAFASPSHPWLLCPGLCCIGLGGLSMFATSIQVSNLFPRAQSTVVAIFCGLFDFSSIVQQVVKIAHESGIRLMHSYLLLSVLYLAIFSVSTFILLPRDYITGQRKFHKRNMNMEIEVTDDVLTNDKLLVYNQETIETKSKETKKPADDKSLKSCFLSLTYMTHVAWMSINMLMFVTFIGLLNSALERLSDGRHHVVSHYLGVFSYTTMSSAILAVLAGIVYDWQRKKYKGDQWPSRKYKPVVLPMTLCQVFGCLAYGLPLSGKISFLFPVFVIFTLYRSFLYSIGIAFVNEVFPSRHFGSLYGVMTFINGLCSMIQYGLFEWSETYEDAYQHVCVFMLSFSFLALIHPAQLWFRSGVSKN